ncbi:DMT family transporter [Thalassococcus sp. CAU 1522]|uniref:DMT family transporter n=1 Tax=Thalassococcus arenae TaxID=2851652 RepID=A0ABS6N2M4_9RHOB|nr:DMT family transporter [Thalassococcus arenae]MBV2358279.1 DMT family transporter [Thalassococcus arenae]
MTERYDNPPLGIALMLGFCIVAPLADALAKLLGPHVSIGQLVFLRFAVQAVVLVPLTLATGRPWRMRGRVLALTAIRTGLHVAGIALMFTGLLFLPLADAVAIAFVMPFIMLLLGHVVLGEEVGWRRLSACAVGFAGTLLVLQPAFAEVGWPALLPLGVALVFALFMLVTRQIAGITDPVGMQAVSALMALPVCGAAIVLAPDNLDRALGWAAPTGPTWILLIAMGLLGTAGHLLMTWSLRYAPASTLAPMQYLEIPVATIFGYLIFADLPGPLASLGIGIILAAGLWIVRRERAMLRARSKEPF